MQSENQTLKMNYVVVGTNDLRRATTFYDALFEGSDFRKVLTSERMIYWQGGGFTFAIARPFDGQEASNGNGTMVGFDVGSVEAVYRLHQRMIELGGMNEGDPGPRGPYFSAYARDLDKNKLCFGTLVQQPE